jgi:DNA-binding transcriptional ArsR family regulator
VTANTVVSWPAAAGLTDSPAAIRGSRPGSTKPSAGSFNLTVILSALADPGRRVLMAALYQCPEPVDCAVLVGQANLGLSNSTISHHYRVLREAGLIRSVADGRKRIITVRREDMEARFPGLLQAVLRGQ